MFTILLVSIFLIFYGCTPNLKPTFEGFYQSENINGYVVQISMQKDDNSFVEYINNREVDSGTYEKLEDNLYKMSGIKQSFEITLNEKSFEIVVKNLNDGNPILLEKINDIPTYCSTEFDDVDEYKSLLD